MQVGSKLVGLKITKAHNAEFKVNLDDNKYISQ